MPALRPHLGRRIIRKTRINVAVDRHRVVVVDQDQVIQPKMARNRDSYS